MRFFWRSFKRKDLRSPVLWWAVGCLSTVLLLLLITLWMAGSIYSELPTPAKLDSSFKPVDVIVCLTGGRGRIRKALELHQKGFGRVLYISGIDPHVKMKDILKEIRWAGPLNDTNIILEHVSTNTIQNAQQVDAFLRYQKMKRVLLVTSIYHVRRAHFIFQKILPREVAVDIAWYESEPFEESAWWKSSNGIWVTVSEFFKFSYAYWLLR